MIESRTQFKGSGPTALPLDLKCPKCHVATQGKPFCSNDGHLVRRPFTVADRYVLHDLIGAGATALVFGGHDRVLGRPIALKMLRPTLAGDPQEAHRFLRAAKLSSQLHHENIVVIHDCGEDTELGAAFVVMERLVGGTLHEIRAQATRVSWERTVRILVQVCRALTESHRLDILHRDLSLRNITLTTSSGRNDVVKLCDFGLARSMASEDRVTSTGTAVGTPAYMAPEQVRGDDGQDHRIDLYALGVIAYELLTGRLPHEAQTTVAMIASKLSSPPTPLTERCPDLAVPAELESLIMRCLHPEPDKRPESASAIERELLALGDVDPTMPRPGTDLVGQRVGHYRVLERLNQGGMGEIYLVEHAVIGTKQALKVLLPEVATNPEAIERFIQEARASSGIGSPHIPRCYDFGFLPDQRAYVLMDLIEGASVAAEIEKRGPLPLADVKRVLQQAADALGAAHELGIIHRDIKPDHIMLRRRAEGVQVTILDFGIAKVFTGNQTQTQVGVFMGTPLYCAPEQVLGEAVSPATDIYSLGATAYEMLSGRPPFSGEAGHVLAVKAQRDPSPLAKLRPALPATVVATIEKMMARDRSARFASMADVARELATWPDREQPSTATDAPVTTRRGRPWLVAVAVVCLAVGIGVAVWPSEQHARAITPDPVPTVAPTAVPAASVQPAREEPAITEPDTAPVAAPTSEAPAKKKAAVRTPKPKKPASDPSNLLIVDPFKR